MFNKSKKTILLTFISIGLIYLFFQFPRNNDWFDSRILAYWSDFQAQKNHLGTEERKKRRWKSSYTISKEIAGFFEKQNKVKNTIVLIPPSGYFKERGIDYDVPEPAVFYYYTGLKTIWSNSHSVLNANWMVIANNRVYKIIPVIDKNCLADSVSAFKKYPLSL